MSGRGMISNWIVLAVDDEPDSIEVVTDVLEFHGATVYAALDGREAVALLANLKPTFILTDLSMPNMNGWDLLAHIRENEDFADVPVIALTAHAMVGDARRAMAAGFSAYLTKPLNVLTLINEIVEQLPVLAG